MVRPSTRIIVEETFVPNVRGAEKMECRRLYQEVEKTKGIRKRAVTKFHLVVLLLMMFILIPSAGWAVTFDIWETGISINEIVSLASNHDIPIMRSGIVAIREHFDPKLVEWNPDENSRIALKGPGAEVSIIYTDIEMKRSLDAQRRQERQRSIHKDGGKF